MRVSGAKGARGSSYAIEGLADPAEAVHSNRMARAFLVLFGVGGIAWAFLTLYATQFLAARMGFRLTDDDGMIEFFGLNAGLWPAVGVLALTGAAFARLRITAIVTIFVCLAGTAVGRVVGMLQGAEPGLYTYAALGFEIAGILLATLAYGSEKREATLKARAAAQEHRAPVGPAPQAPGS